MNRKAEKFLLEELDKYKIFGECKWDREYYISGSFEAPLLNFENGKLTVAKENCIVKTKKGSRRIDAVIKYSSITYIIEAKQELNYKAFGQVFFYEYAYKEDSEHPEHKEEKTKKVIVCKKVADVVRNLCMFNDIDVIEITDMDIKKNNKVIKEKKANE